MRSIRRFMAATAAALASQQFSRAAPPVTETVAQVMTDAEAALKEIGYDNFAVSVRPELLAKYAGDMVPITPEIIAQNIAARRGVRVVKDGRMVSAGGSWRNTTIGGAKEEFEDFVNARMR